MFTKKCRICNRTCTKKSLHVTPECLQKDDIDAILSVIIYVRYNGFWMAFCKPCERMWRRRPAFHDILRREITGGRKNQLRS
jgi:hypothetical protein